MIGIGIGSRLAVVLAFLLQAAPSTLPPALRGLSVAADEGPAVAHLAAADVARADRRAAVAQLDAALALLPHATPLRWATQCMRAAYAVTDAEAAGDECLRHFPDQPAVLAARANAAFEAGESGTGARLMATLLRAHPETGVRFPASAVDGWLRQLDYDRLAGERSALVAALAGSRYGATEPGARATVLREAALDRLGQNDPAAAQVLADQILDPGDLLKMLVDRRYAALWPAITASAGPGLEGARERFVAVSRAAYEARPDDSGRRMLAGVLERTGHADEALALLRSMLAQSGGDGWYRASAAVRMSKLLAQAGGSDAEAVLAPMRAELADGADADHPERGNIVPNLALAQIALRRPTDAIATLDRYPLNKVESPAAGAFIIAIRACALHRLGRADDASPLVATVMGDYARNTVAGRIVIDCTGDSEARARAWIANVRDPRLRTDALLAMVRARQVADPTADPLDPNRDALHAIAGRADVAAAFATFGQMPGTDYAAAVAEWRRRR